MIEGKDVEEVERVFECRHQHGTISAGRLKPKINIDSMA